MRRRGLGPRGAPSQATEAAATIGIRPQTRPFVRRPPPTTLPVRVGVVVAVGTAAPESVFIELKMLLLNTPKHHYPESPVADRQCLGPRTCRLCIPERKCPICFFVYYVFSRLANRYELAERWS